MSESSSGDKSSMAILNEIQVKEIKFMIVDGYNNVEIAKKYCVNNRTISEIKCGTSWKSVTIEGFSNNDLKQLNNNISVNKHNSKFTKEDIIKIKFMINDGIKNVTIAKTFNCRPTVISKIKYGELYKDITIPEDYACESLGA